jgi:hypothetical protein
MRILILFLPLVLMMTGTLADTSPNQRAVDQHILPAYQRLAASTKSLQAASQAYCKAPATADPAALQQAYLAAMLDWQSIQHIRFGPVEFQLRYHRFQLWPDKRGSVSKHLNRLLASEDTAVLQPETFARDSSAVQGFSALYGDVETSEYACQLILAITSNLQEMATGIVTEWTRPPVHYADVIATAVQGNDFFESSEEVSARLLNNLYTGLQLIVDQKLDRPLGDSPEKARGRRAEAWRSEQSLAHIRRNLAATQDLYTAAFAPELRDATLKAQIDHAYKRAYASLDAILLPLSLAVRDPQERIKVKALRDQVSQLKALVGRQLSEALDLPLGFNSLDGD